MAVAGGHVLIRLAQLCWWVGAAALAVVAYLYFTDAPGHPNLLRHVTLLGVTTLPGWLISFALGGTFFTPPRSERE